MNRCFVFRVAFTKNVMCLKVLLKSVKPHSCGSLEKQNTDRCGCFSFWNAHVKSSKKILWHPMSIWLVPTRHNEKTKKKKKTDQKNQSIFTLCNALGHGHYQNWACLNSTSCGSIFNNIHSLQHYVHVKPLVFPLSFNPPRLLPGFFHHMQWRWWSLPKSGLDLIHASCLLGVALWCTGSLFAMDFPLCQKTNKQTNKIGLALDSCALIPVTPSPSGFTLHYPSPKVSGQCRLKADNSWNGVTQH